MFVLPTLNYQLDDFKMAISPEMMSLHYEKHHQAYVDKLNATLKDFPDLLEKPVEFLVANYRHLSENIQTPVRNFAGGHYNHSLFWGYLSPVSSDAPSGLLLDKIVEKFGSFEKFKEEFSAKALGLFGSGWTWLLDDMSIVNTANQDNPITDGNRKPVLCIDVWEHAYYFDYTYRRADFIANFWKIVDWDKISQDYLSNFGKI